MFAPPARPVPPVARLVPLVVVALLLAACRASPEPEATGTGTTTGTASRATSERSPLHVVGGERPHLVDAQGREVLLRGVNVNSFGQYFQADPALRATLPVTDEDWASMAALGFSVVRLIVSWSGLEPAQGTYDEAYIDTVRSGVAAAGRHGLHVVVDLHQDAWGRFIATPPGVTCEPGTEPAIGWDGAPRWATVDVAPADTCRAPGARELSKAVGASFAAFYANDGGRRDALARAWGHLAGALASEPALVGYDLFNEPNPSGDAPTTLAGYTTFVTDSISAIRAAERQAGIPARVAFVEPIVTWPLPGTAPTPGFTTDANVAFAPHNYFGSISKLLTPEQGFAAGAAQAKALGAALWIGEYGWWDDGPESMAMLRRYARAEDAAITGGAWWQWRQACGDPHTLDNPDRATSDQQHLNAVGCPGDHDRGVTTAYATVLSRPYPRAAPGTITSLTSDPDARTMALTATGAADGGRLEVWVPSGNGEPQVAGSGVRDLATTVVPGGFLVTGATAATYRLTIDAPAGG